MIELWLPDRSTSFLLATITSADRWIGAPLFLAASWQQGSGPSQTFWHSPPWILFIFSRFFDTLDGNVDVSCMSMKIYSALSLFGVCAITLAQGPPPPPPPVNYWHLFESEFKTGDRYSLMYTNVNHDEETMMSTGPFGPVSAVWERKVYGSLDESPPNWHSKVAVLSSLWGQTQFSTTGLYIGPLERLMLGMVTAHERGKEAYDGYTSYQAFLDGASPLRSVNRSRYWDENPTVFTFFIAHDDTYEWDWKVWH
jgi:hypothetical protein